MTYKKEKKVFYLKSIFKKSKYIIKIKVLKLILTDEKAA